MSKYYIQPLHDMASGHADGYYTVQTEDRPGISGGTVTRPYVVVTARRANGDAIPIPGVRDRRTALERAQDIMAA